MTQFQYIAGSKQVIMLLEGAKQGDELAFYLKGNIELLIWYLVASLRSARCQGA